MAKITAIRTIRSRSNGSWVFVKVLTDQPGLYGIGSASDCYHSATVITAIEESIGPRFIGRDVSRIEDSWQSIYTQPIGEMEQYTTPRLPASIWHCGISKVKKPACQCTNY
jgi:L-alanine-DL-glutamate epimerase-like enolase superfamily enzyme